MKKKQITNKELQDTLKLYDDDYIVQVSVGEEMDLLTHLFVDSDNGVIDLTNFVDEDESQPHVVDALGNNVYKGDPVLFYYDGIKQGKITEIKNITATDSYNKKTYYILFTIRYDEKYVSFATENNVDKTVDIVKFNW